MFICIFQYKLGTLVTVYHIGLLQCCANTLLNSVFHNIIAFFAEPDYGMDQSDAQKYFKQILSGVVCLLL